MKKGNKLQLLLGAGFCCMKRQSMESKQWKCGNCLLCPFQCFLKTSHQLSLLLSPSGDLGIGLV